MSTEGSGDYGIGDTGSIELIEAPELPYLPRDPERYRPAIGLIGCGGISEMHLRAYREAGYRVTASSRASKDPRTFSTVAGMSTNWRNGTGNGASSAGP